MFNKLVASEGRKKTGFWSPTNLIISGILHVVLIGGLVAAAQDEERRGKRGEELVDFVELEEEKPKEPEPEKPKEPEPPPPEPEPETPPPVAKGTQVLMPPEEPPPTIAPPSANEQAVNPEDFSGQGVEGGVAKGVEGGVAQSTVQRETPPDEGTYELSAVEELPRPTNGSDFQRQLARNYPPLLRDAGVTGTVQVRFRVMEDGRVDAESIQITSSTHEQFNDPTTRAVRSLRFRPARVNGRPVKVWVEQPIQWTVAR
ncbi:MAG TPA: TonB family protein [Longimicrobium sp.]|nr:TonB family protein [Longimicrobium sp.]